MLYGINLPIFLEAVTSRKFMNFDELKDHMDEVFKETYGMLSGKIKKLFRGTARNRKKDIRMNGIRKKESGNEYLWKGSYGQRAGYPHSLQDRGDVFGDGLYEVVRCIQWEAVWSKAASTVCFRGRMSLISICSIQGRYPKASFSSWLRRMICTAVMCICRLRQEGMTVSETICIPGVRIKGRCCPALRYMLPAM